MKETIERLRGEVTSFSFEEPGAAEIFRLRYLSRKGAIPLLFEQFRDVPAELKKDTGRALNELKNLAQEILDLNESRQVSKSDLAGFDFTRPAYPVNLGSRHPISIVRNELISIFSRIGFTVSEGPEIEDDNHVFSKLNFAHDHPARDMQDTFYISRISDEGSSVDDILLRTHTSSVQVRVMENQKPPIRTISPGRVFRNEAVSARAHCIFHQVEGLYIDTDVSLDRKSVV